MRQIPGAIRGSRSRSSYLATEALIAFTKSDTSDLQSNTSHAAADDSIISELGCIYDEEMGNECDSKLQVFRFRNDSRTWLT